VLVWPTPQPSGPLTFICGNLGICRILLFPQVSGVHLTFDLYFSMSLGNFPTAVNLTKSSPQKTERLQFHSISQLFGSRWIVARLHLEDSSTPAAPIGWSPVSSAEAQRDPTKVPIFAGDVPIYSAPKKEKKRKIVTLI
jgi:hypothetical protein